MQAKAKLKKFNFYIQNRDQFTRLTNATNSRWNCGVGY